MGIATIIYVVMGSFLLLLVLIFLGFQFIGYILLGSSPKPIDEEQRTQCHEAIHNGRAGSKFCRYYVKKGYCPHGDCKNLK